MQDDIRVRIEWLERKVTELLYLAITGFAGGLGYVSANSLTGEPGIRFEWQAVFIVVTVAVWFLLYRSVFRRSPAVSGAA